MLLDRQWRQLASSCAAPESLLGWKRARVDRMVNFKVDVNCSTNLLLKELFVEGASRTCVACVVFFFFGYDVVLLFLAYTYS